MVQVVEHLEHEALTDLGSHEAYGATGESRCFCGLAPLLDMNRMEPMMSVLEDKCLHLRSNSVVEYIESHYKSPFILGRSILRLHPHLHPTLCKSLPKMDEQEPVSPAE
nr:glutamyl-tRNA(Gln) amidotransferase subunit C, mitochondrial-like [Odocoileus virginianus texanus]